MKKILLLAGLFVNSFTIFATTESHKNYIPTTTIQSYNNERVVRAYYVSAGRLEMLKIKIVGSKVSQYAIGKYNGQDDWRSAGSTDILRTSYQYDGELAKEFSNKAYIQIAVGKILTIYF